MFGEAVKIGGNGLDPHLDVGWTRAMLRSQQFLQRFQGRDAASGVLLAIAAAEATPPTTMLSTTIGKPPTKTANLPSKLHWMPNASLPGSAGPFGA
jgi:hypothetical protein